MTDAEEQRVRKVLQDMQFPATKQQILDYINERGAEQATARTMQELPDGTYASPDEAYAAMPQRPDIVDPP